MVSTTLCDHRITDTVEEEEEVVEVAKVIFLRNKDAEVEEVPSKDAEVVEVLEMNVPIPGRSIVILMNLSQALMEIFSKMSHVLAGQNKCTCWSLYCFNIINRLMACSRREWGHRMKKIEVMWFNIFPN